MRNLTKHLLQLEKPISLTLLQRSNSHCKSTGRFQNFSHPCCPFSPDHILDELQRMLIDFVWPTEKHHLKRQLLFQKPDKGGLGLSCLQARTLTYRFTRIQGFLNQCSHPSYSLFSHFLYNYQNLHFDFQLFFIKTIPAFYVSLPNYYSEVLRAWAASGAQVIIEHGNINHVMNLPINSCILSSLAADDEPDSVRLLACGIKQIRPFFVPSSSSSSLEWALAQRQ